MSASDAYIDATVQAFFRRLGAVMGEQADEPRCVECRTPTDPDDLADLDGVATCVPCVVALTGDDHGPDRWRDL